MRADDPFPILTPELAKAAQALSGEERNHLTLLLGEKGVGKSFTLLTAAARTPRRCAAATARRDFAPLQLIELLLADLDLTAASGAPSDDVTQLLTLSDRLIAELVHDLGLITIDDAHLLPAETLTWLCDLVYGSGIQLALAGQSTLIERLPINHCREAHAIRLRPLQPTTVPEVIRRFHPVWVGSTPATIQTIDDGYAHGYFSHWAEATAYAIEICAVEEPSYVTGRIASELLDLLEWSDAAA